LPAGAACFDEFCFCVAQFMSTAETRTLPIEVFNARGST
jgi:ABC-type spermidine/putrescine transport system permease subunit II